MFLEEPEKRTVRQILSWVEDDQLGIPDFQRDFVWARPDIEDLFESILRGYYIGAFLFWSADEKDDLNPTRIYGVESSKSFHPSFIVLDGQQRISSLYYAMKSPPANLWGTKNPYLFYINLDNLLKLEGTEDSDELTIVESIMQEKAEKAGLMDEETQFKEGKFPISKIKSLHDWLDNYERFLESSGTLGRDKIREKKGKLREALSNLWDRYQIPVIKLPKEMNLENVAKIFEKLNSTGQNLTVFDLLNARLTKYGIQLRSKLWKDALDEFQQFEALYQHNERFPVTLLHTMSLLRNKPVKKKDLLNLDHNNFVVDWQRTCKGVQTALEKLANLRDSYGVLEPKWMPFAPMLPPFAALLESSTGRRDRGKCLEKIRRWYWSAIRFSAYESSTDTQMASDVKSVTEWFDDDTKIPPVVSMASRIQPENLEYIYLSSNALYKSVICLIALKGAKDFVTGQPLELSELDDHHIFPKSRSREFRAGVEIDSILNKTLLDKNTNRNYIRASKPSEYLEKIMREQKLTRDQMISRLESHLISKEAFVCMEKDDMKGFMVERKKTIIEEFSRKLL